MSDKIKCPECGALFLAETGQKQAFKEELDRQKQHIENVAWRQAAKEFDKKTAAAVKKALEQDDLERKDLQNQVKEQKTKLKEAQKTELDLRRRERVMEDKQKNMDLEIARQTKSIEEKAKKKALEERRMQEAEKDKTISDLQQKIGDWQRRAEQGSQQTQGEVQELELEKDLKRLFPFDIVRPVPSGMRGADLIQEVRSSSGNLCGKIIWESKRTKNWSDEWLSKLKEDRQKAGAEAAVIVSQALPKEIKNFGLLKKVMISDYTSFPGLAALLRESLIKISSVKRLAENREGKTALLFEYITSPEFQQKIESVNDFLKSFQEEVEKEKRYFQRRWAKQEKQIESTIQSLTGISGEIEGLAGPSAQSLPALDPDNENENP